MSTAALAQVGSTPIEFHCPGAPHNPCQNLVKGVRAVPGAKDTAAFMSFPHAVALRGVALTDSTAAQRLRQMVFQQADEIWTKAATSRKALQSKQTVTKDDRKAFVKVESELADQLLPKLRPLIPADQQATFDRNFQALRESDYVIVTPPDTVPVTHLVICAPSLEICR